VVANNVASVAVSICTFETALLEKAAPWGLAAILGDQSEFVPPLPIMSGSAIQALTGVVSSGFIG